MMGKHLATAIAADNEHNCDGYSSAWQRSSGFPQLQARKRVVNDSEVADSGRRVQRRRDGGTYSAAAALGFRARVRRCGLRVDRNGTRRAPSFIGMSQLGLVACCLWAKAACLRVQSWS
jgi:hypothetical protein